jgi:hypothetical protein
LTPDGESFAYVVRSDTGLFNRVRVVSFSGKAPSDIVVQNATKLTGLVWLPSNSGFLTTDGGKLLMVSSSGTARVLWAPASVWAGWAVPSPDEKHLAINVGSRQTNAWMMTGF